MVAWAHPEPSRLLHPLPEIQLMVALQADMASIWLWTGYCLCLRRPCLFSPREGPFLCLAPGLALLQSPAGCPILSCPDHQGH